MILTSIRRKNLLGLIRETRGPVQPQLLLFAVDVNFVLGAIYLYYFKGLRCEGLQAYSRIMSFALRIPYVGPEQLKYDFQKGVYGWFGWQNLEYCSVSALPCDIDGVPNVLFTLHQRSDDTYNILKYCETTGKYVFTCGFKSLEACEEFIAAENERYEIHKGEYRA